MNSHKQVAILCFIVLCCLAATAAPPAHDNPKQTPAPAADQATVTVSNLKFEPRTLRVKAGTTVTWLNKEGAHTVAADKGAFESDTLSAGQSFSYKFAKPGKYPYYCTFHGSKGGHDMAGVIIVVK